MRATPIFLQQTGLKTLGFDPGPVDGVEGPQTRAATTAWLASQVSALPVSSLQCSRWAAAQVMPDKLQAVEAIVRVILSNRTRYEAVAASSGVPWWVIAGLHNMESSGSFRHHLHEGSPLTGRTKYVPKDCPRNGNPPFTWEESALDALRYDQLPAVDWSSLDATLYACERYNGLGYLKYHPATPTPYLWAATTVERPGKYTGDGQWSATARSQQIGIAAIWKVLEAQAAIALPG